MGGGIAQFFAGSETHVLLLWVAAFIGAIASGIFSALVIRNSLRKAPSRVRARVIIEEEVYHEMGHT